MNLEVVLNQEKENFLHLKKLKKIIKTVNYTESECTYDVSIREDDL